MDIRTLVCLMGRALSPSLLCSQMRSPVVRLQYNDKVTRRTFDRWCSIWVHKQYCASPAFDLSYISTFKGKINCLAGRALYPFRTSRI
nr:hypothetical protein Iba_chr06aCG4800 [Ipomoea batatas]GMD11482.1 hypothetical protein Iba_chr06fCG4160 [Ipomoea batatas]